MENVRNDMGRFEEKIGGTDQTWTDAELITDDYEKSTGDEFHRTLALNRCGDLVAESSIPVFQNNSEGEVAPMSGFTAVKSRRRIKVLLIGQQYQVASEGQAKAEALSRYPDLEIHVLMPSRYCDGETHWRYPSPPTGAGFNFSVEKVNLAWMGPAKWYLQWYPNLAKTLRFIQPDVIDVWEEPWNLLSAQIRWLRDRYLPRTRIVCETEQNVSRNLPPPFEWIRGYSLKKSDYLIGRNSRALAVSKSRGYQGASRVVGNGFSEQLFRPLDRELCRSKFSIHGFAVGYVGRLVAEKGIRDLLSALLGIGEGVTGWFCGDGLLKEQIGSSNANIHHLQAVPREKLPALYNALDVLILPSRTTSTWMEQFGRVIIEAQACGIPVIGSDSGAIPEVLGDTGLVFREGDIQGLRAAIQILHHNREIHRELSLAGMARVHRLYSWQAIAAQMREVYHDCMLGDSGITDGV